MKKQIQIFLKFVDLAGPSVNHEASQSQPKRFSRTVIFMAGMRTNQSILLTIQGFFLIKKDISNKVLSNIFVQN